MAFSPAMNEPGRKWRGWSRGEFQAHFIHTGVAESVFFVFPDSTTMLLDCGDQPAITRVGKSVAVLPGPERLAGEWIARYVARVNPNGTDVDWAVVSHFHSDHAGTPRWQKYPRFLSDFPGKDAKVGPIGGCARSGFGLAAEFLRFRRATDRGWPGYDDPIPLGGDGQEQHEIAAHVRSVWDALRRRDGLAVEPFRLGASDQFVPERGDAPGFMVRNVFANGRIAMPDGSVRDLYANLLSRGRPDAFNENAMSLGMMFSVGPFRLFCGGDFSDRFEEPDGTETFIEDALAETVGRCNVAKVNHHGHHAIGRALAGALNPQVWVACVWDVLHMTDDTAEVMFPADIPDAAQPLLLPTVLPVRDDGARPWHRFVPDPCRTGCHVVLSVPPGGENYTMTLLDARDEDMRVVWERSFAT